MAMKYNSNGEITGKSLFKGLSKTGVRMKKAGTDGSMIVLNLYWFGVRFNTVKVKEVGDGLERIS